MSLKIYNTLTREKEVFTPINKGYVGMYVCIHHIIRKIYNGF